ncbi:MAG: efflux RND transporter permease subunit [bacterium]|nr:efflux RND transporter permease subunit [bacterium]
MLNRIIHWSLTHRTLVLFFVAVLVVSGFYSVFNLPIDAFPDTTPIQVQINTVASSLSPSEMEQQVTFPIEQAISGLPNLKEVRSISKFGLSQVTVVFDDKTGIYLARQLVMEKLQSVELSDHLPNPQLGPVSTGLGEIFHYIVSGKGKTLEELTTIHDWIIKPRLASIPGVAEVNTWGGKKKQYHVMVDLSKLIKYGLTASDVEHALYQNNLNVGGGNLSRGGEMHVVHGIAQTTTIEQIAAIVIKSYNGSPVFIKDVAEVKIGHDIRRGACTADGKGEVVLGLGFMLMGENSHRMTGKLQEKLKELKKSLPQGVVIQPVYARTDLVDRVLNTVKNNLLEGACLVVAILFIFLGNLRAGLIVASMIPLSMLFAFNWMYRLGIAGSLMSLGAIDFGFIVDSSLVMVENNYRHLKDAPEGETLFDLVYRASSQVIRPTIFAQIINMIVYLPVLVFEGIEGKLFGPMALTILFALSGSILLICTAMPVFLLIFSRRKQKKWKDRITPFLARFFRPLVLFGQRHATSISFIPPAALLLVSLLAVNIGSEFIPRLSEMGIVINAVRLSGVSLDESIRYGTQIERYIKKKFPDEIKHIWVRTGTAEVATDPMGIELSDVFITLTDRDQWQRASTQEELTEILREELSGFPGMKLIFTQPIEMRVNEMIMGIRSDLGIKIFGDDLNQLKNYATQVETILKSIEGSTDIYVEQITGLPVLEIKVNQEAIARYGVSARKVLDIIEMVGIKKVGEVREGQRRFTLGLRLDEKYRKDPLAIGNILIPTASNQRIPLAQLADIKQKESPSTITREWQQRRIVVQCNVTNRDIGGFVKEVSEKINQSLRLPAGYYISFGGQFQHLKRAQIRLLIVVPAALLLIFFFLFTCTGEIKDSLIIFSGPLFAALGGLIALTIRGLPFSISAGVGFVVAAGVSVLNGLVMVSTIKENLAAGMDFHKSIVEGALVRLRPIVMAGLVAAFGFLPMAVSTGVGAEVQRPLATVVIGAVIFDNILTITVLPALYTRFKKTNRRKSE